MDTNFLFVYGTLRKAVANRKHNILAEYCDYYGEGIIFGKLFEIDGYPGLILSNNKKHSVKGEVYTIKNKKTVLQMLDDYEECSDQFPEPREYVRTIDSITLASGESVKAWIYVYNRNVSNLEWIKSGDYQAYLKRKS